MFRFALSDEILHKSSLPVLTYIANIWHVLEVDKNIASYTNIFNTKILQGKINANYSTWLHITIWVGKLHNLTKRL